MAGSCFAQRIAESLRGGGFNVMDVEPAPMNLSSALASAHQFGIYSARYGNIYTAMHLRQLFEEALEDLKPAEPVWMLEDRFYDAMRPTIEPGGFSSAEEVLEARAAHLISLRQLLSSCDVFIFTMGLTEAWVHSESGTVYPTAPGTIAGDFRDGGYELVNLTAEQVKQEFERARALIHSVNPNCRFIITVSPVPLTATATGKHALVANSQTKSTLRTAAAELYELYEDVDYFPSYELIATHLGPAAFEDNLRSVAPEAVKLVTSLFLSSATGVDSAAEDAAAPTALSKRDAIRAERRAKRVAERQGKRKQSRQGGGRRRAAAETEPDPENKSEAEQECEDVLLEAFAPAETS